MAAICDMALGRLADRRYFLGIVHEVVCRPAGSSVRCSVQQVAGAVPRPAMLQDLHHSPGSQEAQHSKPERLPTSRSDLRGHESVGAPGSQVPQGSH